MDLVLEQVLKVAQLKGPRDPDRKSKELFVRFLKNEGVRKEFSLWVKTLEPLKEVIKNERELRRLIKMHRAGLKTPLRDYPMMNIANAASKYELDHSAYLHPALYSFALFGKVNKWPIYGCHITRLPGQDYEEPGIIIYSDASQEDVINFIKQNWNEIQEIHKKHHSPPLLGHIRKTKNHELNAVIYSMHMEGQTDQDILRNIKDKGFSLRFSKNPIAYIKQTISREKKISGKR